MTRNDRDDPPVTEGRRVRRLDQQTLQVIRSAAPDRVLPPDEGRAEGSGTSAGPDQNDDRGEPVVRLPDGCASAGFQQEHGAAHLPDQRLAGQKVAVRLQTSNQGLAVGGAAAERTLCDGSVPDLGWT